MNKAIEMYLFDKKKVSISKQNDISENDRCQYTKFDRNAFFNEKKTACYLARVCVETLLKDCSESMLEDMTPDMALCKIT